MIRFACPKCKSVQQLGDEYGGSKFACRKCGQRLQVPTPSQNQTLLGELVGKPAQREDNDEEEERPRAKARGKAKAKESSANWPLLLGVGGGLAVLVVAVVVVLILLNSNNSAPEIPGPRTDNKRDNKPNDKRDNKPNNPSDTIVQGEVTFNGKRLNGGAIDVDSSPPRGAGINPDGTFRMKGVPPGKHKVKFVPLGDPKEIEPSEAVTNKRIRNFPTSGVEVEVVRGKTNVVRIDFRE